MSHLNTAYTLGSVAAAEDFHKESADAPMGYQDTNQEMNAFAKQEGSPMRFGAQAAQHKANNPAVPQQVSPQAQFNRGPNMMSMGGPGVNTSKIGQILKQAFGNSASAFGDLDSALAKNRAKPAPEPNMGYARKALADQTMLGGTGGPAPAKPAAPAAPAAPPPAPGGGAVPKGVPNNAASRGGLLDLARKGNRTPAAPPQGGGESEMDRLMKAKRDSGNMGNLRTYRSK